MVSPRVARGINAANTRKKAVRSQKGGTTISHTLHEQSMWRLATHGTFSTSIVGELKQMRHGRCNRKEDLGCPKRDDILEHRDMQETQLVGRP